MPDLNQPATKGDLDDLEREIIALRWFIGLQVTYFFGTLAMVYFLIVNIHK